MFIRERTEWRGGWGPDRQELKVLTWRCTKGHRMCEGPRCRNEQPSRWHARFCSSACRLRAWRAEKREPAS